jgi:hypothetical protein
MPDGSCTLGKLTTPSGWSCYTIEKAWKHNERAKSCIPDGWYKMILRESPVVHRTSKGEHRFGWEITNVVDRTFIMFHVANWESDLDGCIGVGSGLAWTADKGFMVTHSLNTFRAFMQELSGKKEHVINIHS